MMPSSTCKGRVRSKHISTVRMPPKERAKKRDKHRNQHQWMNADGAADLAEKRPVQSSIPAMSSRTNGGSRSVKTSTHTLVPLQISSTPRISLQNITIRKKEKASPGKRRRVEVESSCRCRSVTTATTCKHLAKPDLSITGSPRIRTYMGRLELGFFGKQQWFT